MSVVSYARDVLMKFAIKRTGGIDLSQLDRIPDSLAWPLQRDGLAPTARLEEARSADPVQRLTSFMGLEVWLITGYDEAREVLERLRGAVAAAEFLALDGRRVAVTLSVGVAAWDPTLADATALADLASQACLAAKAGGCNRVVTMG